MEMSTEINITVAKSKKRTVTGKDIKIHIFLSMFA